MIREGIHDRLKNVYDEFDRHCRTNNIDYSIDADYCNVQAYRLVGHNDIPGVLQHMANYVRDKGVGLDYDGFPVKYDELKSNNFNVATHNPLFKFTLTSLQEDEVSINEDSIKGSNNAHGRRQSAFPSSFEKNKTRDTYGAKKTTKKKKKKKKVAKESLDLTASFGDRLDDSLNEHVGLSMVDPDILMTMNPAERPEDEEESLESALQAESIALTKYLAILEGSDDEHRRAIVETLAERCTQQINELNRLIGGSDGTA
jgi:rubrerythrin